MKTDLQHKLEETSKEFFGQDALKVETTKVDGKYVTVASIKGIPEMIEASDENKDESRIKAINVLVDITMQHLEKDMFPTRPDEEYTPVSLNIKDLMNISSIIQSFLEGYMDKYDDDPKIKIRFSGSEYECVVEAEEGNIHSRRVGKTKNEAIEKAVRFAVSIMYPTKLMVREVKPEPID